MKRALLIIIATLNATSGFGQLRLGAEAGFTLFNTTHTASNTEVSGGREIAAFKPGLKLGVLAGYPVLRHLTVQSGISLTTKGFKDAVYVYKGFRTDQVRYEWSTNINYLEVALSIMIKAGKHLSFGAGGYFGYALSGRGSITTYNTHGTATESQRDLIFDNPQTEDMIGFKKTDYGLLFFASYSLPRRTFVQAQFSKGLKDIMPEVPFTTKTETYKNWGFTVSAGWYFAEL